MRLAVAQLAGYPRDVPANLILLDLWAGLASDAGADVAVFPELFLTGYNLGDDAKSFGLAGDGPELAEVGRIASRHRVALVVGYPERVGDGLANTALFVDPAGHQRLVYRKTHLYAWERRVFRAGDGLGPMVEVGGLTCGLLICYDVEFPEAVRRLALAGCDAILVPTALPKVVARDAAILLPARALENHVYIAYANRCGTEAGLTYAGNSVIVAPDGQAVAQAGDGEQLIFADLVPAAYEHVRQDTPYLTHRRPALYGSPTDERG